MENTLLELTVPDDYHLERIDRVITQLLEIDMSRSYIQKLIKAGDIRVNGETVRANYKAKTDDSISVNIPEPEEIDVTPEDIPLEIIYEDDFIAVINKQPGLVVHPGPGNWDGTMVNGLLYRLKNLSGIGGALRPGIVHRLDRDTSGLMVVAKNDLAHSSLVEQFASRKVVKKYAAVVTGRPHEPHGIIDAPIGRHRVYRHKMTVTESGKEAVTEYNIVKMWNTGIRIFSLLDVRIHTGRTHQIRVHLSSESNPIVGDPIYSKKWEKHRVPYLLLASVYLSFRHPESGAMLEFKADLPEHMKEFLGRLEDSMIIQ